MFTTSLTFFCKMWGFTYYNIVISGFAIIFIIITYTVAAFFIIAYIVASFLVLTYIVIAFITIAIIFAAYTIATNNLVPVVICLLSCRCPLLSIHANSPMKVLTSSITSAGTLREDIVSGKRECNLSRSPEPM